MAWTWRYEGVSGGPISGPNEAFSSQSEAESWLGQHWRDLVSTGAMKAVLREENRTEYTMDLIPEDRD